MDPALEASLQKRQRQALERAGGADRGPDAVEGRADRLRPVQVDDALGAAARFDDPERRQPAQLLDEQAAEIAGGADDQDLWLSRR